MSVNEFLAHDFQNVQQIIEKEISPDAVAVKQKSFELFQNGGKKIRPTFTLLVGKLGCAFYQQDIYRTAASLELIHMATLVHDDIIDNSELRRGRATVYYERGYHQAVFTGNFLLSTALKLVSHIDNKEFHNVYAETIQTIVKGELTQFDQQFNARITLDDYYEKTYRKTALLIETSVVLGALASHLPDALTKQLKTYAYHIGMSFQIIDDCLDFTGDEALLGKPKYSDMKNGHYTLPVILLRDKNPEFAAMLDTYSRDKTEPDVLINMILASDSIDQAIDKSADHIAKAIQATDGINEEIRFYLVDMADKLQKRIS